MHFMHYKNNENSYNTDSYFVLFAQFTFVYQFFFILSYTS